MNITLATATATAAHEQRAQRETTKAKRLIAQGATFASLSELLMEADHNGANARVLRRALELVA